VPVFQNPKYPEKNNENNNNNKKERE